MRRRSPKPYKINKFYGLNTDSELSLKDGETIDCENFIVASDNSLKKRYGFEYQDITNDIDTSEFGTLISTEVLGTEYAKIGGNNRLFVFVLEGFTNPSVSYQFAFYEIDYNNKVYIKRVNINLFTVTITENYYINYFIKNSELYFMIQITGTTTLPDFYRKYDGTTISTVIGYIPTLYEGVKPDLTDKESKVLEQKNIISQDNIISYLADGTSTIYKLGENAVSITEVTIDGTPTTAYTFTTGNDYITFNTAPTLNAIPKINFKSSTEPNYDLIFKNNRSISFGGTQNIDLHIWGNQDNVNKVYYTYNGDVTYFPVNNYYVAGDGNYAITDIVAQYSRLVIFTEKEILSAPFELASDGTVTYPITTVTKERGHNTTARVQMILNQPVFINNNSIWVVKGYTNNSDDRNIEKISYKVENVLKGATIESTLDFENQYFIFYTKNSVNYALIFNYQNKTWYKFNLGAIGGYSFVIDDKLVITTGQEFYEYSNITYDSLNSTTSQIINAYYELPYLKFTESIQKKSITQVSLSMQPHETYGSYTELEYSTNNNLVTESVVFYLQDGSTPQTQIEKINIKNIPYLKLKIISDNLRDVCEINSIIFYVFYGGLFN